MLQHVDKLIIRDKVNFTSRSEIIRRAVQEFIVRLERNAEEKKEREIFRKHRELLNCQAEALIKEQAEI